MDTCPFIQVLVFELVLFASCMKVAPKAAEALGAAPAGGGFIALSALLRSLCPCPRAHAAVDTAVPF